MSRDLAKQMLPAEAQGVADRINGDMLTQLQAAATELYNRASPRMAELATVLGELTHRANAGDQPAKKALAAFFQTLDDARAAAGGLIVAPTLPPEFLAQAGQIDLSKVKR